MARSPWRLAGALAAVLALFADRLPPWLAAAAIGATFLVTPGALAATHLFSGRPREELLAALAGLSPFLVGAPLAAAAALGVPLPLAARALVVLIGLLALVVPGVREARPPADRAFAASAFAALAWGTLVAVLLVGNRWLPPRSDGWFHAAVTAQIAQRGVPPEDPYFAGLRLLYFWGLHVWAAGWLALAPRLAVWTPLIAFNLAAAPAVMLALAALARRLGAGARGIAATCALAALGYSPFTWLTIAAMTASGEVRGWPELVRTLGHGIDPVLFALARGQLHLSLAFFGDKYLVLTQFSMGLALLASSVLAMLELASSPGPRRALALFALTAATLFTHTVVGYVIGMLAGLLWLERAVAAARGDRAARAVLVPLALAIAGAVALLVPYLLEISHGKRGQLGGGFSGAALVSLAVGGALYVLPGFRWLWKRRAGGLEQRAIAIMSLAVLALGLGLRLSENNQSKFFNFLFLLLAAPAALAWVEWWERGTPARRRALAAFLALAVLPSAVCALTAFATERGQAPDSWRWPDRDGREALAWVRAHTPADAILCDLGGAKDLVTLGARSVYWGGHSGERDWGYPPQALAARRDLVGALCRGEEPGEAGRALLAQTRRELVVVQRAGAPDSLSDHGRIAADPARFELLWRNPAMAFWKVRRP